MPDNESIVGKCSDIFTPCGSSILPVYVWNKDHTALVQSGERNIQEEINAAAVGVTPYELIERFERSGDASGFDDKDGVYADVSGFPDNMADAKNTADSLEASLNAPAPAAVPPAAAAADEQKDGK